MLLDPDQRSGHRRNKINWVTPRTLGVILLFLALVMMLFYAVRDEGEYNTPFERIVYSPVALIQKVHYVTSHFFTEIVENFRAKGKLDRLQVKLERLQRDIGRLEWKLRRFEAYREALELPKESDLPTISAMVLIHDKRMTRSLIINRGTEDGIQANMAVWDGIGLIGRTTAGLSEHRAKVQPITDPRSAIGVRVQSTEFEGLLRGTEEGDHLLLTDIHQVGIQNDIAKPREGQAVFTSGMGLIFPRNLLAGYISSATSDEGIVVEPAVAVDRVESVMVIMNTELREETIQLLSEK
ncbi:hypothetical protein GF373_13090 [bacterium]|nr:hypothetical protein [bacterium]